MPLIGKLKFKARREKLFGAGRPRPLDRNAKVRITHLARCLSRRTEKGKAYGQITAKALSVLDVLLWVFHNAKSGLCFPSYERIAEAACCARSTVAEAIKALEDAGILSWVNRIKRVAEASRDLFGRCIRKTRVIRTSNGYAFIDPKAGQTPEPLGNSSKSLLSGQKENNSNWLVFWQVSSLDSSTASA
jgi:Helix-turn-helix domain